MATATCVWATEDVIEVAPDLSERQAGAVLLLACVAEHNAELGVNWDVLKAWAHEVRDDVELENRVLAEYGDKLEK